MKQFLFYIITLTIFACGSKRHVSEAELTNNNISQLPNTKTIEPKPTSINDTVKIGVKVNPKIADNSENDVIEIEEPFIETNEDFIIEDIDISLNHRIFNALLQKHVSTKGNVNYKELQKDKQELKNYISYLYKNQPNNTWSENEKLAYWINAYNALTIDLVIRNYPLKSIKDIENPWDQRLWKLGEKWLNLNDIEHKILRKMNEPRIHFAIVCASESCPKLLNKAFNANNLDTQLTEVTKAFLADTSKNEISENEVKLSKIFKWFAKDFKSNGSLIDFLNQYTDVKISPKAKKSFLDYDWNLNE